MDGSQISTDSLLLARGVGSAGLGIGGYNNGIGLGSSFANQSTLQHGIHGVGQRVEDQADATREFLGSEVRSVDKSLENLERSDSFNRICDAISSQNNVMGQNMLQMTRDMADARAEAAKCCCDTQKEVALAAKDAAKCCCDTNLAMATGFAAVALKACEDKNDLSKQMAEGFAAVRDRELNAANSRVTQLETINALRTA